MGRGGGLRRGGDRRPVTDHIAAIRAYKKVGFRPVGVMRRYDLGPDGTFHDDLLMDLLPEKFIRQ